ncbi:MAG: cytochrome c oxidase subunit 3 [Armatimonadota bacterium]|nr:cytochrome c oxidase subunit 3 [Armatimonadota bacterium]MDR7440062.1 cytochrome c oxidase subunit 3 [Armatimonadota bacterium]MDR7562811.1 cytochrome c oxidase subunit 3 [Armatimonadota bacterium]MDR7568721.1 cytochrome c oxidase subunit 3 [Armatimonadota bacterium]MDR7601734.1 cytochrome c oxidase subunit 3 [Armatimonadota bacterium]
MAVTVRDLAPPPPKAPPPDDRGPGGPPPAPRVTTRVGVWLLVGAVSLFFLALTSALLARQAGLDWGRTSLPRILWLSTAAILASSALLEAARASLRRDHHEGFRRRLQVSALLGVGFLAAQLTAWRTLVHQGVHLATNPHTSYFYLLTGAHAVHLLGGLVWFGAMVRATRRGAADPERIGDFAVYWHFLAGLWVYLFAVLFL